MIQNANVLLRLADEADAISTSALQTTASRFQNPGSDHRNWFKHWFWAAKLEARSGELKNVSFNGFRNYFELDTRNHRRGTCLTNSAKAFDHYYNTLAHTHVLRPYSILSIAAALVEMINELDFEGRDNSELFSEINNQLKRLFLKSSFPRRLFDTDEDQEIIKESDPAKTLSDIQHLIETNNSMFQEKISSLEHQLENIKEQKNVLEMSIAKEKELNKTLTDELHKMQNDAVDSQSIDSGNSALQANLIKEIEFDSSTLETTIEKFLSLRNRALHQPAEKISDTPEFYTLIDSLNNRDEAPSPVESGFYLKELLSNFKEAQSIGFSNNLHAFIANLWLDVSDQHYDLDEEEEVLIPELESVADCLGGSEVPFGELSWEETKIELDELRREIKAAENLENWENPLMREVIDRVGEKKITTLKAWTNDDVIQEVYHRYEKGAGHYLGLVEFYWPSITEVLEDWNKH